MEIVYEWLMTEISVSRYPCENNQPTGNVDCFSFEEGGGGGFIVRTAAKS